jgi:hypothetical protein
MVYQLQPLRIGWRRRLEKEEKMAKKVKATCIKCGTHDGLFIMLGATRLPSYTFKIGEGIICNKCKEKAVA